MVREPARAVWGLPLVTRSLVRYTRCRTTQVGDATEPRVDLFREMWSLCRETLTRQQGNTATRRSGPGPLCGLLQLAGCEVVEE